MNSARVRMFSNSLLYSYYLRQSQGIRTLGCNWHFFVMKHFRVLVTFLCQIGIFSKSFIKSLNTYFLIKILFRIRKWKQKCKIVILWELSYFFQSRGRAIWRKQKQKKFSDKKNSQILKNIEALNFKHLFHIYNGQID